MEVVLGSADGWVDLLKVILLEMTEELQKLPAKIRPNIERVKETIENQGFPSSVQFVIDEIAQRFRNAYIIENVKQIANLAKAKGLDFYILIGQNHGKAVYEGLTRAAKELGYETINLNQN